MLGPRPLHDPRLTSLFYMQVCETVAGTVCDLTSCDVRELLVRINPESGG